MTHTILDWGAASEPFDDIARALDADALLTANEAQTRFQVIDRVVREVLGWSHGQITVEERTNTDAKWVDYVLRAGDHVLVIEAKRTGAAFPSPTRRRRLKLTGSVLSTNEVRSAIHQARQYGLDKEADACVVTNGLAWIAFDPSDEDGFAQLTFPFELDGHAEELFRLLHPASVAEGSLNSVSQRPPELANRLISSLERVDGRIGRNSIADHIAPALDRALYADAILADVEQLERCYVATEARTKFDNQLGMHLADVRPREITPAPRVRRGKEHGPLESLVESASPSHAPPVTLIIGPVGAGKSTYLNHFEKIGGERTIAEHEARWIYIDFEEMGPSGSPNRFLYEKLRTYLLETTDYKSVVEPAYDADIRGLARGPLAPIFTNKPLFKEKISSYIQADLDKCQPYVDKLLTYLAGQRLCVVVLDNVDLYEDENLEKAVVAEGIALSKRIRAHVIVALRDTTFVRHRTDSVFDAYQLRKLWLDPPPFKAVLSARLSYSKKILEGKEAKIDFGKGMTLRVPDLSIFFEIVQQSVLRGEAGDYVDAVADFNIRRGLDLVTNFLTSGHIQADRAVKTYIDGDRSYRFPFHEIFKGTMLGQWRHFREDRSELVNLFDARMTHRSLRLLRLHILRFLFVQAQHKDTLEVPFGDLHTVLSGAGASEGDVLGCLRFLRGHGLVRTLDAMEVTGDSTIVISRSGGYYLEELSQRMPYVEECLFDTAIEDTNSWMRLSELSAEIEAESSVAQRMVMRRKRLDEFLNYMGALEEDIVAFLPGGAVLRVMPGIATAIRAEADEAVEKAARWYT
jgi:hypothetical protein